MTEHLEERVSERLQGSLNQPSQRGYQLGCYQRGTQGVGKNGYSVNTLMGNWSEEQSDTRFCSKRPLLLSDREQELSANRVTVQGPAKSRTEQQRLSQNDMIQIINKDKTIYPGHQPHCDLQNNNFNQWASESCNSYSDPSNKANATAPKALGKALSPMDKQLVLIKRTREALLQKGGSTGFRGIRRQLQLMDTNGNNQLERNELAEGLQEYGIDLTEAELNIIFNYFDKDGSGSVSLTEFLSGVRGPMPNRRTELVKKAYKLLDKNLDGTVTMDDILRIYDAATNPAVLSGEKTEEDVLKEFISGWDQDGDCEITVQEFCSYYQDISAGIDNEQYFELMVRNTWHISGGTGAMQNTSCRRVLVTHRNGQTTVQEIKNDLGIGPNDLDKMMTNLNEQGINDITSISLT